jgi:alkaline phosphatase
MQSVEAQGNPRRVVFFVVDGAGIGIWSMANYQTDGHAIRRFPVVGLVDTRAAYGFYPGSASAGTSFAVGERTFVGAIAVGTDSLPRETVLELAQKRGLATGLVTTARITDATPAAFSAHTTQRTDEESIAWQQAQKNVTVFMGGGRSYFDPGGRTDSLDLLARFREQHTYVETHEELRALSLDTVTSLYGLFTWSDMPVYPHRSPSLAEMASAALDVLDKDPDGFFLLLETESTDTEGHHNVEYDVLAGELLDVDATVNVLLAYQNEHPETLILMLGDHDTGGLAVQSADAHELLMNTAARLDTSGVRLGESAGLLDGSDLALVDSTRILMDRMSGVLRQRASGVTDETLVARYTTGRHTANMVPLFAKGPDAERFAGVIDNFQVGRLLLEIVGR